MKILYRSLLRMAGLLLVSQAWRTDVSLAVGGLRPTGKAYRGSNVPALLWRLIAGKR
jgi:hypothetical protein